MGDTVIRAEGVSKKFARRLRYSMMYGTLDVARGMLGMEARTDTLRPGEFWAVDDVSFELKRGETLGLIGPNGSGKSTLLRLLNGIYQPDRGRIEITGRVGALIAVGAGFHPLMTGRENIYLNGSILGMTKSEIDRKFEAIAAFADIDEFLDSPVKTYSSGMYMRLGFAVAIHCEPDVLLVDEVLAVGDYKFQKKCFDRLGLLREEGTSVILVTHGMHHLTAVADKAVLMQQGEVAFAGDVNRAVQLYNSPAGKELGDGGVEKIVTCTDKIEVSDVKFVPEGALIPGRPLRISLRYKARSDIPDAEVDVVIMKDGSMGMYFQATNRTVEKVLDIPKGDGVIEVELGYIPINSGTARLAIAIWESRRRSILFWWRNIPIKLAQVNNSTGENYLPIDFRLVR